LKKHLPVLFSVSNIEDAPRLDQVSELCAAGHIYRPPAKAE